MVIALVAIAGFATWILSTLSGGGGALLLTPVVALLIGARAVAPIVTLTSLMAEPARVYLSRRHIEWPIVRWYLPGAIVGAVLGAWAIASVKAEWLQVLVALFLLSTAWQYRFGERERSFRMPSRAFLPLGFAVAFFSGLIGATGPILNPFYLNYGAIKERMIATKGVNSLVMHLAKLGTYTTLGAMPREYLAYGIMTGLSAFAANWAGKRWLEQLSNR